jgi:NAD(P)-dependent dehydrogenase (short-subunit alcohol dehydrogenase family)
VSDTAPVLLIAGGSGAIGAEIARQASAAGWTVALHGRRAETIAAALAGIAGSAHRFDFVDPGAVEALVAEVAARHGRIDAVIDCTTGGPPGVVGPFAATDPAAYAVLAAQSAVIFQRLAHAALPWLKRRGGTLIAFVSDAGVYAAPRQALIGAARAATIGFVRNLALEIAREGVRVHAVSPSFVEGTTAANRSPERLEKARTRAGLGLPTPADIAPLALFLCGPGAARITGQVISVTGGLNA